MTPCASRAWAENPLPQSASFGRPRRPLRRSCGPVRADATYLRPCTRHRLSYAREIRGWSGPPRAHAAAAAAWAGHHPLSGISGSPIRRAVVLAMVTTNSYVSASCAQSAALMRDLHPLMHPSTRPPWGAFERSPTRSKRRTRGGDALAPLPVWGRKKRGRHVRAARSRSFSTPPLCTPNHEFPRGGAFWSSFD
jgi:hypothetical protein